MSKHTLDVDKRQPPAKTVQHKHQQQAQLLLDAYLQGDPQAIEKFHNRIPDAATPGYKPSLLQARMLISSDNMIPKKLSLEKLKKEAKDLLKQLKSKAPDAIERLESHHHIDATLAKLADAQLIIARENNLPSWAKLKHHIESMNQASKQINDSHKSPDGDSKTLHIRCGNDIEEALLTAGFTGKFLEVSNPFPQGQVPHFEPLDEFVNTRKHFLIQQYGAYISSDRVEKTESEIRHTEEVLRQSTKRYQRIILWYEHDSFDQLSKAYVLAHLSRLPRNNTIIECIQIENFPGIKKFIGIGQLSRTPEAILTLWSQRQPVTNAMITYGTKVWHALTNDHPQALWQLTQETNIPLPQMPSALKRTLQELPWIGNGLSLTEYLALDILAKEGEMRPAALFTLFLSQCSRKLIQRLQQTTE